MESIKVFLQQTPPTFEWQADLNEHLPGAGEVPKGIPLIRVVGGDKEILLLKTEDVCTDSRLIGLGMVPPDGLWANWSDLIPAICGEVLANRLANLLLSRGLSQVPLDWRVEFCWLGKEQKFAGEFE